MTTLDEIRKRVEDALPHMMNKGTVWEKVPALCDALEEARRALSDIRNHAVPESRNRTIAPLKERARTALEKIEGILKEKR